MKKIILIIFIVFGTIKLTNACLPPNPSNIIIGKNLGIYQEKLPSGTFDTKKTFLNIKYAEKPFKEYIFNEYQSKVGKYYYFYEEKNIPKYSKNDVLIMVADYNDGSWENYYAIYDIAKITCKNDIFKLDSFFPNKNAISKGSFQCGNYKPKDVPTRKEILNKIKNKYRTCNNFNDYYKNYSIKRIEYKLEIENNFFYKYLIQIIGFFILIIIIIFIKLKNKKGKK